MTLDYTLLGKRVAQIRREQGLTQERLAEQTDVSNMFISHIENCRSIPSLETVMKLCDALGVTPNELLLGLRPDSSSYLNGDILRKLEACSPAERRLVNGFLDLLAEERGR